MSSTSLAPKLRATSLISEIREDGCFSFPSKILAFRSHQIVQHTKMMSERVPLLLDEPDDGVRFSNQSVSPLLAAQLCGW
jgi:hypothetical protein